MTYSKIKSCAFLTLYYEHSEIECSNRIIQNFIPKSYYHQKHSKS